VNSDQSKFDLNVAFCSGEKPLGMVKRF
jgi:hypothetical protein